MKEFVSFLVKQIVSNPDEVVVTETNDEGYVRVEIKTAPEDIAIIIGKEGRTIRSLRNLAKAKAIKENIRVSVDIIETVGTSN